MPRRSWTPEEVDWLRQHLHLTKKAIAAHIGCTPDSVKSALRKHSLKLEGTGRFAPGSVPYYKGKKLPSDVKAKVAHTWFKKGNLPHNTKHDGHVSVRVDGDGRRYYWIRLAKNKHQHLHRYLWEQAYGAVPDGHVITFKDGKQENCVLENLECITEAERLARTSVHNLPEELKRTVMMKGVLKRMINKRTKDHEQGQAHK
jgi:hypothetical protein